jgi:hypothetical protein
MVLLRQELSERLGALAQGQTVTVNRYVIFHNRREATRGSVFAGKSGLIPSAFKAAGDSCPEEKTTGGWFDPAETTTPFSPIIVQIEATMDGRTRSVRTVYSPSEELYGFGEPAASEALFAAMRKATEALAQELGSP